MLQTILFYALSLALILFALGVVLARQAVRSLLCLVAAMAMIAALFILQKATLIATILILVYAGAILVLFLFIVMLVDFKYLPSNFKGLRPYFVPAVLVGLVFFVQAFIVISQLKWSATPAMEGKIDAIGRLLFSTYLLPFELTSFLVLAAIVGVVVLAKKGQS